MTDWATESALAIAIVVTVLANMLMRGSEHRGNFWLKLAIRTCNTFVIAAIAFYAVLTIEGVAL